MNRKQNFFIALLLILCVGTLGALLYGAGRMSRDGSSESGREQMAQGQTDPGFTEEKAVVQPIIQPEGETLEERFREPEGYRREKAKKNSLTTFLRTYPLKKHNSPVLCYNGKKKGNQNAHAAIFRIPLEPVDLQQCADSIMRVYAEYYWKQGQYDKIAFHFVSGFLAEYSKWRQGYRIRVSGNDVSWVLSGSADTSYQSFQEYMAMVFTYASTLSMEAESKKIDISDIQVGDVFLYGGSPGHVVMVVDLCVNEQGEKAFLLAQGYMPAQEFHVLKNPFSQENPWYYETEVQWPFTTPEYTFEKGSLRRLDY